MQKMDVSDRSAPILERQDGHFEWAGLTFPTSDEAHAARRVFRAITFGIVYGGSGR